MIKIDLEKCIGCGLCVKDCCAYNIELQEGKASVKKECFKCGHCVAICPAGAVTLPEYDMTEVEEYTKEDYALDPQKVLNNIKFRRSIRSYKSDKVGEEALENLIQAGRYTATAKNNQECHFIFVQNEQETLKTMVWDYIEKLQKEMSGKVPEDMIPYIVFNRRRKADPENDYLFRNAPMVLFITSDWQLDAGLAAQNIETMAVSMGMGALYNGFLARIADENEELKKWLGIEEKTIKACMLLGYPDHKYVRTAPRKEANVILK